MIRFYNLQRANAEIEITKQTVSIEAPNACCTIVGIDDEFIYFNVSAKLTQITPMQQRNLIEKTRFVDIRVSTKLIYHAEFKVSYL